MQCWQPVLQLITNMKSITKVGNQSIKDLFTQIEKQSEILKEIQRRNLFTCYMNAREAAKYLGISERLFNERLKLGVWTSYRVGKRRVFRPCDLDADLEAFKESSRYR